MELKYYAIIDSSNTVIDVIQTTEQSRNDGMHGPLETVIETDPNAAGGRYFQRWPILIDDRPVLRKNFARKGYRYDPDLDAFIPPSPYPSWVLDTDFCAYVPPFPPPDDGKEYHWDENIQNWAEPVNQENL